MLWSTGRTVEYSSSEGGCLHLQMVQRQSCQEEMTVQTAGYKHCRGMPGANASGNLDSILSQCWPTFCRMVSPLQEWEARSRSVKGSATNINMLVRSTVKLTSTCEFVHETYQNIKYVYAYQHIQHYILFLNILSLHAVDPIFTSRRACFLARFRCGGLWLWGQPTKGGSGAQVWKLCPCERKMEQ